MKYQISSLSFKKYSLILACPFFLLAFLIWNMESWFEPLNGDLTRLGYLFEEDFGWNKQQPLVPIEHMKSFSIEEADVLVIGDSFSVWTCMAKQASFGRFKTCYLALEMLFCCVRI